MATTQKVSVNSIHPTAATFKTGGQPVQHSVQATDKDGNASGSPMLMSSSNPNVARPSSPVHVGHAPLGIIPVGPGTAQITATPIDNAAAASSLTVTVS